MRINLGQTAMVLLITVVGSSLIVLGVVLIFLPGPGILFILLGLAVLAKRFSRPRKILNKAKEKSGLNRVKYRI